ncbi:glycerol-3-phosphate dehydrogenase/oxidase [Piscibacillus sp. B03]|uniref:glycerol-3-phosphate dehydrogenase/oxidase n=1 Tax=Piscibacillus sp. B03 TaxID=3457430 RepID=UPI003FCD465C
MSNKHREENKSALKEEFDLVVIGGGITGAGIALDAVTRGLSVVVLEMQDFAAGTSSRSTKLVHGGLRYLKNFEVKMVAEVGKERDIVYENGPHVTTPEWMMLPFYEKGTFGPLTTNLGLRVYDFLAGVKKDERRKMLTVEETLDREPLLNRDGLKGSGYYVEYKTDDARLTLEVLKKAIENGATAFNYMKVEQLLYNDGHVVGVKAHDLTDGTVHEVFGKKIVNATGPWVDQIRSMDHVKKDKYLFHTKGVHLVFDHTKFPLQQAIYYDTPDGRMVFAIPRDGKTYVGTTDTPFEGDLTNPTVTREDRIYLLETIHQMFPNVKLLEDDIESTWSGVRPLIHEEGKSPSEISRKDEIFVSDSGLMSIAGGKLTGYRKMAQQVVDLAAKQLNIDVPKSSTKHLPISGGDVNGSKGFESFSLLMIYEGQKIGIKEAVAQSLVHRYGSNVQKVFYYYEQAPNDLGMPKEVYAELMYTLEYEQVYKPVDFFVRRTGALYFNIEWVKEHQHAVTDFMKKYFNWRNEQYQDYVAELQKAIKEAKEPVPQI